MDSTHIGNCWFYGDSAHGRDCPADLLALREGATRLRDGEVVVVVDDRAVFYVMPLWVFKALVCSASGHVASYAATGPARITLLQTAAHRNVATLPDGTSFEFLTLGNLPGAGALLFTKDAFPDLVPLAAKKLTDVVLEIRMEGERALVKLAGWKERA